MPTPRLPLVADRVKTAMDDIQPPRGANYKVLFEIAKWLAVKNLGETNLKAAWKAAQTTEGVIPSDDALRELGEGTHVVLEQGRFSATAKVTAPRKTPDMEALGLYLSRNHGISIADYNAAVEACKKEGTAPLEKRVLEVP